MISKRKLIKWRKEALQQEKEIKKLIPSPVRKMELHIIKRVLVLTQELIDQQLLKEK